MNLHRWYRDWAIQREMHIADPAHPLSTMALIWDALKTASPPLVLSGVLFCVGVVAGEGNHVTALMGDLIACIALWFGLSRSTEKTIVEHIAAVCRRLAGNVPHKDGFAYFRDKIPNYRENLRIYSGALLVVNVALFLGGIALSMFA
jgi:hypothetical protein